MSHIYTLTSTRVCAVVLQEMIDTLRKMHPNNHQAVLDMVISHQGLPHKIELVKRILSTLVLPAPVPYRSLLRRFAALSSKGTADVAVRARQLLVSLPGRGVSRSGLCVLLYVCCCGCYCIRITSLQSVCNIMWIIKLYQPSHGPAFCGLQEVSLLADLRAVVARALSGLDMFSDADGKLSPTVSGSIGGASKCISTVASIIYSCCDYMNRISTASGLSAGGPVSEC